MSFTKVCLQIQILVVILDNNSGHFTRASARGSDCVGNPQATLVFNPTPVASLVNV
jgi:hypothetical protein